METIYQRVAGLDIHKANIVVCLRKMSPDGSVEEDVRTFATMTDELLALCDCLSQQRVTHVAMESTGVLWKPIWNILEGNESQLQLVNAREHHQFMLEQLMDHLAMLEEQITRFTDRITEALRPFLDKETFDRLDAIPGVNRVTIENVVAQNWCGHE